MSVTVEKRTKAPAHANPDLLDDAPRDVVLWADSYHAGELVAEHRHRRAQLLHAVSGVMTVTTPDGSWVVPPHRALWVPAATDHAIRMTGAVSMRTLYVEPGAAAPMPRQCCVLSVSPLLRELILRAMELPRLYDTGGAAGRLIALILDEIRVLPALPLHLPMPAEPRLAKICGTLLSHPEDSRVLEAWGRSAGASGRTLARLFRRETGMSFGAWRQQARLIEALARLGAGEPVTNVALELGYESPSAFTAMFRRSLGVTPSRYFDPPRSAMRARRPAKTWTSPA
jgi:AraC-like DNA-binding protein/mannose-6-phosphate isomerase-like protein (cupin superfamily)